MLFYIFETQVPHNYKFGTTKQDIGNDRLKQYTGLNKPKRIITTYTVENGFEEEKKFKAFLEANNINSIVGREYFFYQANIDKLIYKFKDLDTNINDQCEGKQQNATDTKTQNEYSMIDIKNMIQHQIDTNKDICDTHCIEILHMLSQYEPQTFINKIKMIETHMKSLLKNGKLNEFLKNMKSLKLLINQLKVVGPIECNTCGKLKPKHEYQNNGLKKCKHCLGLKKRQLQKQKQKQKH